MSKLLKVLFSIFASVILLVIISAIALPSFIDPNDFKPEIEAAVKDSTGRDLQIEGNLELSVFPWIGVSTGKLVLSNAKGFDDKPFAEIAESNLKVKLLPLFTKQVEVSRIVLKGLNLNLAKNKKGVNNWDDMTASSALEKSKQTEKNKTAKGEDELNEAIPLAAFAIGGIAIEQAKITWDDQQEGKFTEINEFNLTTDKLEFEKPVGIDLSFSIINKDPELVESINFTTDLLINESLDNFQLKNINLESETTGKDIPGNNITADLVADVAIDLSQQTLTVSELILNIDKLRLVANINGSQIIDKPKFDGSINIAEFNLEKLMANIAMPLPEMQDSSVLNLLAMSFTFTALEDSVDINNIMVKVDQSHLTGSAKLNHFDNPSINFNLKLDAIDIDRYLPVEEEAPATQKAQQDKPVLTPARAVTATATLFPVETLRGINANGQISIDKLKVNQMDMKGLDFQLKAKNGAISTRQTVKQFYQGSYTGSAVINVQRKTPRLSLNEKLIGVQIEPLLKDMLGEAKITGRMNASAKIKSQGNTEAALKSSLNGQVDFNFKDGIVKGFNLQKIIDNSKALIAGNTLPSSQKNDQTVFSVIKGSAQIKNGVVSNKDLLMEASKLRVNGKGTVNLVSEKIDYAINAKLLKKRAKGSEVEKIKGIIPIKIGRTLSNPSYTIDVIAMLSDKNKAKLNKKADKLLKKLDKKFGPGVGDLIKGLF